MGDTGIGPGEIHVIFGRRGAGKTTLSARLACVALRQVLLSIGPKPWWARYGLSLPWTKRNAWRPVRLAVFDPRGQIRTEDLIPRMSGTVTLTRIRAALDMPEEAWPVDVALIDEVDMLAPASGRINGAIRHWANYGRHDRMVLICNARRPARVSRDLTALADVIHVFQTREPRDVAYLVDLVGSEAEAVSRLEGHNFLSFRL